MLTLKLYAHSTWATSYCDVTRQSTVKLCSKGDSSHSQWETEQSKVFLPREPAFTFTNTGACCNKH